MLSKRIIFEIHRLIDQGLSQREIACQLRIDRASVAKYLDNPERILRKRKKKPAKLDPYRDLINEMVQKCPRIKAPVVLRKIRELGFDGEITIVRNLLRTLRKESALRVPYIRFESKPGMQVQVDWAHFPSLDYGSDSRRKLYALVMVEAHSRMLFVWFTHSQRQECLHQGLLMGFKYFGGSPKVVVVDNMLTAVTERIGPCIRFNESFLDFLRHFHITPHACTIRAPHEKGKVENGIKYIRRNFWPLIKCADLKDAQQQVLHWLNTVANVRKHQTTGQRPVDRLRKEMLRPLPDMLPDCRETCSPMVHKDFGVRFDTNVYTVPPWTIGKKITLKADQNQVCIYFKDRQVALHARCWKKNTRIELPEHKELVRKLHKNMLRDRRVLVFLSLGPTAEQYLEQMIQAKRPVKKNIVRLLALKDEYGRTSFLYALQKALDRKLYGADYVQNILFQEMTPVTRHLPVKLKQEKLNEILLTAPSLEEYDSIALQKRRKNKDG